MKKILAALMAAVAVVLLPMAAGAAPPSASAGAAYGEHVSGHAAEGGLSGTMNPGVHRGFADFSEHH